MGFKNITNQEEKIMEQVFIACMYQFYQKNAGNLGPYGVPGEEWTLQKVMYDYYNLGVATTGEFLKDLIGCLERQKDFRHREKKEILDIIHNTLFTHADTTTAAELKRYIAEIAAYSEVQQIVNRKAKMKQIKVILENKLYAGKAIPHHRLSDMIGRHFRAIEEQVKNEASNRNISRNIFATQYDRHLAVTGAAKERYPLENDQMVNNQPRREDYPNLGEIPAIKLTSESVDAPVLPESAQENCNDSADSLSFQLGDFNEAEHSALAKSQDRLIVCNLSCARDSFDDYGLYIQENIQKGIGTNPTLQLPAPSEVQPNETAFKLFAPLAEVSDLQQDQEVIDSIDYEHDEYVKFSLAQFIANLEADEVSDIVFNSFSDDGNRRETSESF